MSYSKEDFPQYVRTAGKITIVTALTGLLVFVVAFMFDVGSQELSKVSAQTATTTLTVLNTPPQFTTNPYEVVESSTSSPTNSGDVIQWSAVASDSNGAPYFLLVCSTNATPTANKGNGLGSAPPSCSPTSTIQWGVSASTTSGAPATVSTTTSEAGGSLFGEIQNWYAWVCDDDPVLPRCNTTPLQGTGLSATSSPFNMNRRPVFDPILTNNGPVDPSGTLVFNSTSTDPDSVGGADSLYLVVCNTNTDYSTTTNTCPTELIASTTLSNVLSDAAATFTVPAIQVDDTYSAFGYIVDEHGHEALANPLPSNFDVANVAPIVLGSDISFYGEAGPGSDLTISVEAGETPSSTIEFRVRDANSCGTFAGTSTPEITGYKVTLYRSGAWSTTTCNGTGANYDPNSCYDNGVPATTWNLSCSATTTCSSLTTQDYMDYKCDFPLWFVADPTDDNPGPENSPFAAENWLVAVAGIDDDSASGTLTVTDTPKDLISYKAIDILANEIVYGGIEPGDDTVTLSASSTAVNVGNTGLDQSVEGESMCDLAYYGVAVGACPVSGTSTIPVYKQQYGTSTLIAYGSGNNLFSTSTGQVELDIPNPSSTSTQLTGVTYWGIGVPDTITLAGSYTGLNTFYAETAETGDW